ncbi:Testis-expressed sequence 2 protein [Rhynchospora pubera]|uniref:Testis-expressed sequence 2 protein n=1 Tax=Rhynchospora pubera TaxID=906938 RepID=A0AAV8E2Y6_9POAL|nr:Testis-expressed sequence 2 protein [Rhynchospora pubera]
MIVAFSAGFLTGLVALLAIEVSVVLLVIRRLGRKKQSIEVLQKKESSDLDGEPISISSSKTGFIWVLEPDKIPKVDGDMARTSSGGAKDPSSKKKFVEVTPVKKYAKIKDQSLIISDYNGTKTVIELLGCTVVAVSSSDLYSRKWDKKYPIKLEDNQSKIYKGHQSFYIYAETNWEKESWCKALRLASSDKSKHLSHCQLIKDFHDYLSLLNAKYPSFLKPSILLNETMDKQSRPVGPPSRVGFFMKKIAKKASTKAGFEGKTDGETKITEKFDGPAAVEEKCSDDEGTLCLNLLFSRLFFDAKRREEIGAIIKNRIQRTLSNMRLPSYIGKITCTGLDLGTVPPYLTKMRVLPMNLDELSAVEVEFEYSGDIKLDFETRLEIREPELQQDILHSSREGSGNIEVGSDLLESIEQYGNVGKPELDGTLDNKHDLGKSIDEEKLETSSSWASSYVSRWKNILHSFSDQVSQVPLSLEVKIGGAKGTLRLYVKPPPSDQIWFGFQSMPDMEWNIETSIGDRKITNSRVGSLIGNRFKAGLRENLVLPNCGSICVPFMIAEKDDWVERDAAPFVWVRQEPTNSKPLETSQIEKDENTRIREESKKETEVVIANNDSNLKQPLLHAEKPSEEIIVPSRERDMGDKLEDSNRQKKVSTRAKMIDFGRKMGDKLEEKRRHIEEKSRHIVEKMRENART